MECNHQRWQIGDAITATRLTLLLLLLSLRGGAAGIYARPKRRTVTRVYVRVNVSECLCTCVGVRECVYLYVRLCLPKCESVSLCMYISTRMYTSP